MEKGSSDEKRIEYVGSAKDGYWQVYNKKNVPLHPLSFKSDHSSSKVLKLFILLILFIGVVPLPCDLDFKG